MFETSLAPLRRRLLVLVGVALLPAVALGIAAFVILAQQQHFQAERATVNTVRAMVSAVDKELQLSIAAAQILATSRYLDSGDLRNFYDDVRRVLAERPSWETIVLLDTAGQQLFNALRPFDTPVARVVERESYDEVLRDRRPVVGDITKAADGRMLFAVRVPVIRDGQLRYVLSAIVKPEMLLPLLARQKLPAEAVVTVFDSRGNVVARSRRHEQVVGTPISTGLREIASRGSEGVGISTTLEGELTYSAFARSEISRWGAGLGIPRAMIDSPIQHSYMVLALGVFLSLALGVLAATLVARRISGPILELGAAAEAMGHGALPLMPRTSIPEVRRVAEALAAAAEARWQAEEAREELLERERQSRAAAEDANRMKDEFLAMLGHELRNPLAAISNAAQILDKRGAGDDIARSAQRILARQVDHLARLMDDLLDVGRVMTGKIVIDRVPMDLADAVRLSLATLRAAGRLEHHDIKAELSPVWIHADRNRIEQVIINLVANAVKYTPASGAIAISVNSEGDRAILRVRDEGMGMERELTPRIFDLFVQGKQALDRAQGGLGIGLTLVRRLVELHGGTVGAESPGPGKGSTFTVSLPLAAAPLRPSEAFPPDEMQACRQVLIVEDNDDTRAMMRLVLEMNGHTVHEAGDGPGGTHALLCSSYDVAFVDIGLPGFDGYELARRIRAASAATERTVRLVAISGYGLPDDRRRAIEAGFDVHLIKPVSAETLAAVLRDLPAPGQGGGVRIADSRSSKV